MLYLLLVIYLAVLTQVTCTLFRLMDMVTYLMVQTDGLMLALCAVLLVLKDCKGLQVLKAKLDLQVLMGT